MNERALKAAPPAGPAAATPIVSVVVVVYNGRAHLEGCLAALAADTASPAFDTWVVDNASPDGSAELAEALTAGKPGQGVVRNATNRGYAGGLNSALPHARGEFVAVLNTDCRVEPGWLGPLVAFLNAHPEAGAVNPLLLLEPEAGSPPGAPDSINAAGQDIHVTGLGFNRWLGQPRGRAGVEPLLVSGLQGGAFVIRRALLDAMQGWDETGFLYHEDVELSWLLQLMGCDLYCVPASIVRHKYHLTMYPEKLFLLERNRWAMLMTHLEPGARWRLAPWLLFTEAMMWGYCLLRGPAFLKAKAASYGWVARQGLALAERRRFIAGLRRRDDRQVLNRLAWHYAWDQFFSLGRERGDSRRKPAGGIPVRLD